MPFAVESSTSVASWSTTSCWCRAGRWRARQAASSGDRRRSCSTNAATSLQQRRPTLLERDTVTEKRRDLLEKLKAIEAKREIFEAGTASPGSTVIERVLGPCEIVIGGRPTLMFGSNNYLGLTFEPEVVAAAREAIVLYGTGTTGSRTANGTMSLHEDLERALADWFGKKHALIFSTGYQANLSVIGGLCGPD